MTDEPIIPEITEPDVIPESGEPEGYGFTRLLVSEFDAYDAAALARIIAANNDTSLLRYTSTVPDTDPLYCWARQEPLFTDLMTGAEFATVISREDAILQGMDVAVIEGE